MQIVLIRKHRGGHPRSPGLNMCSCSDLHQIIEDTYYNASDSSRDVSNNGSQTEPPVFQPVLQP